MTRHRVAGGVRGHDEGGDSTGAVVADLGEEDNVVGHGAAGDVHLLAVDDVVVAVAAGPRLDSGDVGAGVGFGEAECAPDLARGGAGQPLALLLL